MVELKYNAGGNMLSSKELYVKVDKLRIEKGLTQNKLSELAGISHGTLNSWKTRGTMPKYDVIEGICDALDISPISLLYGEDMENLSVDELEMLSYWRKISEDRKKDILSIIKVMMKW